MVVIGGGLILLCSLVTTRSLTVDSHHLLGEGVRFAPILSWRLENIGRGVFVVLGVLVYLLGAAETISEVVYVYTYVRNTYGVSHTACEDEFRQKKRSHSWSVF